MPKLIIPNAYELYQSDSALLTQEEINARYFYNLRFLWLLECGDAIILPKQPAKGFLSYLTEIKNMDPETLHLVILDNKHSSLNSAAFSDPILIGQLQKIITSPLEWRIEACYYNRAIIELAEKLHLTINPEWKTIIESDFVRRMNSKVEFRKISLDHHIPIPDGYVCLSRNALAKSLKCLLKITGHVIIKQEYNASGKGNIGISFNKDLQFIGVIKTIILNDDQCIDKIASELWSIYTNQLNNSLVVEVYHSNKGTCTAQFRVEEKDIEPELLCFSEIIMEQRWVGVQIPPRILSREQTKALITYSKQFAYIMQSRGYRGYICCDIIVIDDDKILFTEINVRPAAETHAYVLLQHFFGMGYENKMIVLTRNGLKTGSFMSIYQQLKEEGLLLNKDNKVGIILLTVDNESNQFEYLIAATDLKNAHLLEKKLNNMLSCNNIITNY